jgi:hypothetical protein
VKGGAEREEARALRVAAAAKREGPQGEDGGTKLQKNIKIILNLY